MADHPLVEHDGLAALTAVRELTITLIQKGVLSRDEGLAVFTKSAELNEAASKLETGYANKDAGKALRECIEEMTARLQAK